MSPEFKEQLSALMDGELGRDEARFLLKRSETDIQLSRRWTRYHVARQALRRQPIAAVRADFAAGVMARLDAEAVPQSGTTKWLRWGSGGAIAAAVAVAALIATKPVSEPANPQVAANPAPVRPATSPASPVGAQLASTGSSEFRPQALPPLVPNSPILSTTASFGTDVAQPAAFDPRLQSYVIRHYEATGSAGQPDFVPYILLVPSAEVSAARPAENR